MRVPGAEIYYRSQGCGAPLVLIGGGPSNADTLTALAGELASSRTVITYDRRGYSRSRIDDPGQPAPISLHANDVRQVIEDLGCGPAAVFATSVGALIGLQLAAGDPGAVTRVVVHEPPLGQFVAAEDRAAFDLELDQHDASPALDQIAASIGLHRRRSLTDAGDRPEVRQNALSCSSAATSPRSPATGLSSSASPRSPSRSSSPQANRDATSTPTAAPGRWRPR